MMETLDFEAMNTSVQMAAEGGSDMMCNLQAARELIERYERRFSRFLPNTEVSLLNHSARTWMPASQDLIEILLLSLAYHRETNGLFDPSILPALKRLGYDRSMVEIRREGATATHEMSLGPREPFSDIEIDVEASRVRMPLGMEIDLGGIAKGWIVDKAAALLAGRSRACAVSAGGDIVFRGAPLDGSGWHVHIEDPRDPTKAVLGLRLGPCAVATSSVAKRSWMQNGRRRHHLIDPRTGEPTVGEFLSATVVASSISTAEVYAKVLLVGGREEQHRLALRMPDVTYFMVRADGTILSSPAGREL